IRRSTARSATAGRLHPSCAFDPMSLRTSSGHRVCAHSGGLRSADSCPGSQMRESRQMTDDSTSTSEQTPDQPEPRTTDDTPDEPGQRPSDPTPAEPSPTEPNPVAGRRAPRERIKADARRVGAETKRVGRETGRSLGKFDYRRPRVP